MQDKKKKQVDDRPEDPSQYVPLRRDDNVTYRTWCLRANQSQMRLLIRTSVDAIVVKILRVAKLCQIRIHSHIEPINAKNTCDIKVMLEWYNLFQLLKFHVRKPSYFSQFHFKGNNSEKIIGHPFQMQVAVP